MRRFLVPLLTAAAALPACTDTSDRYPSLLPRAIEGQSLDEPEVEAPTVAADPALDARIAEAQARIAEAEAGFVAAAQDAEAKIAVARGTAPGSDVWMTAQAALGEVGIARSRTLDAIVALEQLAIDRGVAGEPAYPPLETAIDAAVSRSAAQQARFEALDAALAGE